MKQLITSVYDKGLTRESLITLSWITIEHQVSIELAKKIEFLMGLRGCRKSNKHISYVFKEFYEQYKNT